jgi:D-alanyl-D-alanine carboxypeptidase
MQKRYWFGLILGALLLAGGVFLAFMTSPITAAQARATILERVKALQQKSPQLAQTQMLVVAPNLQFSSQFGTEKPFHIASVGKLFTTVLIAQLIETGKLKWESKITALLPKETLNKLFVVGNVDHQANITLEQLLKHTSGIADYFSDPIQNSKPLIEQIVLEPQKTWTPQDLLEVTQTRQQALYPPETQFHYSDTGYILLGLIIEAIYQQPFETVVHQRIFEPLGMTQSYFPFRTQPKQGTAQLSRVWINGTDLSQSPALTVDWAGGGIASTTTDLLKFAQALNQAKLLKLQSLEYLSQPLNRFEQVIRYGRGMMRLKFADFFPLLQFPDMIGHMGVLGTQLMYNPNSKTTIIISLGSTGHMQDSVQLLIETLGILGRIKS